jgi:hypothetical protein
MRWNLPKHPGMISDSRFEVDSNASLELLATYSKAAIDHWVSMGVTALKIYGSKKPAY